MFGNSSENDFLNNNHSQVTQAANHIAKAQATFMAKVYGWMFSGLTMTGITSYFLYESGYAINLIGNTLILFLALLGLSWFIQSKIESISLATARILFVAYALLLGVALSVIFLVYTSQSIASVFLISATSFGALSAYGFITKRDLTGVGSFMYMGFIGIFLASLVNILLKSDILSFVVSFLGVFIFSGLTAYYTQTIKDMYLSASEGKEVENKTIIIAALTLYITFINLFMSLLRLLGDRK